ncbi:lamin tail domain-containing protein [Halomarina salina]|uniref:Lamin tail domain-containing protein n=1 Tax=Halomarina salina TaxID=1872699 RepID=A0ABD5RN55_9EURY
MTNDQERVHPTTLVLDEIHENPADRDAHHLNEEFVAFENDGPLPLAIGGWTVADESGAEYRFPKGTSLEAGERLVLRSGSGTDTDSTLYWSASEPVWANPGDTVVVRDAEGRVRIRESYNE